MVASLFTTRALDLGLPERALHALATDIAAACGT